nr:cytosol aminopeptidase-like [Lytechinus pictus]
MAASMRLCRRLFLHKRPSSFCGFRWGRFYSQAVNLEESGVVVGVYEDEANNGVSFTPEASKVNEQSQGQLRENITRYCQNLKKGKSRVFYGLNEEFSKVAVVGLGKKSAGVNDLEEIDEGRENVRVAMAAGVRLLRDVGCKTVAVDPCSDAEAAAEGSVLSIFEYDELKAESSRKPKVNLSLLNRDNSSELHSAWKRGETMANAQNFARTLMEMPANKLTPTSFSEIAHNKRQRTDLPITIQAHSRKWASDKKMGAFLSVAKGSDEPPIFMDVRYNGASKNVDPLVLIGKGVTFDSGGISIKPAAGMDLMRGDMGGAANVLAAMFAMANLELPVNVVGLIPLCENMVNGSAVKPGDVVTAMNGKTIQVGMSICGQLGEMVNIDYASSIHCWMLESGVVVGVYEDEANNGVSFYTRSIKVNEQSQGHLRENITRYCQNLKKGKSRVFYGLNEIDEGRENVRVAMAAGVRLLRDVGCKTVAVDPCKDAEAAAEGSVLSIFEYDELKAESSRKPKVNLSLLNRDNRCVNACYDYLLISSRKWASDKKMGAFLSVAKGSDEPPIFMDVRYNGASKNVDPLVLIGKGVTFDSGGISIKPAAGMDLMRGDMGGAANVLAAMFAMANLELPVNVVGLIPLCENMVNGSAVKPGDVVTAMNGKTIQVDNTDAEGRLLLADALCYATSNLKPTMVLDLATLTGAIDVALGSAATGVFTNSQHVWDMLRQASVSTGDRMWRMPLFKHYTKQVTEAHLADVSNIGKYSRSGGSCTAAAFLREFITDDIKWAHLDIAGVMQNKDEIPYLGKGMSGRPVRTLIDFVSQFKSV